jgi:hypothetical protein
MRINTAVTAVANLFAIALLDGLTEFLDSAT